MLTKKQIDSLPKGDYPNWRLMAMFPKQQGPGKSAKIMRFKENKDGKETFFDRLVNQFNGKFVHVNKHRKIIKKQKTG